MPRPPTLRDVARYCGLSLATVSYALRGHNIIAAATREKVEASARTLGYVPNLNAALLGRRRKSADTPTVRPTLAYLANGQLNDQFVEAMRKRALGAGYSFDIHDVSTVKNWRSFLRMLWTRGVQGLFIGEKFWDGAQPLPELARFCIIWVNSAPSPYELHYRRVRLSFEDAWQACWDHTLARSYRRIGCAHFAHATPTRDDRRLHGVALECRERAGGDHLEVPVLTSRHEDRDAFLEWVRTYKPDAIVALHPATYWWLTESGIRVPEDIALASPFLNPDGPIQMRICGFATRPETLVEHAIGWMGDLLVRGKTGQPETEEQMLILPAWHEGITLPPRR